LRAKIFAFLRQDCTKLSAPLGSLAAKSSLIYTLMRFFFHLVFAIFLLFGCYQGYLWWNNRNSIVLDLMHVRFATRKVECNYGKEVETICKGLDFPHQSYFKALIILESSAEKNPKTRYEAHVFERLKAVRDGKLESYNHLTQADLQSFSNQELTELATSWGPLQLMGYHTLQLKIPLSELKTERALAHSIKWCKKSYGNYLNKGDYENAFHIHNTGKPLGWFSKPQTHDPHYIFKGLHYIRALERQIEAHARAEKP
jgi:hypothetical protein